jgi:hypothetical protein
MEETTMSGIAETATANAAPASVARGLPTAARLRSRLPRWCYGAALLVGLATLVLAHPAGDREDIAQLERLARQIERAQALAPDTRETVNRLIVRQSITRLPTDESREARRRTAIERATAAMAAKDGISTAGSSAHLRR